MDQWETVKFMSVLLFLGQTRYDNWSLLPELIKGSLKKYPSHSNSLLSPGLSNKTVQIVVRLARTI